MLCNTNDAVERNILTKCDKHSYLVSYLEVGEKINTTLVEPNVNMKLLRETVFTAFNVKTRN